MALNEHQKSAVWEQVWYDNHGYFDSLDRTVHAKLTAIHSNLLEIEKQAASVIPLPAPDTTNIPKEVEPASIPSEIHSLHDPSYYSFDGRKLWITWAQDMTSGAKRGTRPKQYPIGAIVHWTAGHRNGIKAGAEFQKESGMSYFLINAEGDLGQGDPLDKWGYHAGASSYPGVSGTVSDDLVGFELQAAGELRKNGEFFFPWWDEGQNKSSNRIPASEVVYSARKGNISPGFYHAYTQEQMFTLRKSLCWLHLNYPSVFQVKLIAGHDEVSPGRKSDPGGALVDENGNPITMSDFRDVISDDIRSILANR